MPPMKFFFLVIPEPFGPTSEGLNALPSTKFNVCADERPSATVLPLSVLFPAKEEPSRELDESSERFSDDFTTVYVGFERCAMPKAYEQRVANAGLDCTFGKCRDNSNSERLHHDPPS